MVCPLAILVVYHAQHFSQGPQCSDILAEGGHSALFRVPSPVNRSLRAISDSERYLHLIRDVHGDLQEQGEYVQHKAQAVFDSHPLFPRGCGQLSRFGPSCWPASLPPP